MQIQSLRRVKSALLRRLGPRLIIVRVKKYYKNLVIIHGAGPKHYRSLDDGSGDWQEKLSESFKTDFKVVTPQMPSPKNPSYQEWKILLDKNLARLKGEVVFIGHSLGGAFLVKYLSEENISLKISGLFLVAAPFNTVRGFEAPEAFSKLESIKNIFLYHCINDVEVPVAHSVIFQNKLNAKLKTFNNRGHYFKKEDFPEIVQDIKSVQKVSDTFWTQGTCP